MADKLLDAHRDHLVERHRAGVTAGELAREFGVAHKVIVRVLGDEYQPGRNRFLDANALVDAYQSGASENAVAMSFGVSRSVVRSRLIDAGIPVRNQSEAETLKWSKMSKDARRAQVSAANRAVRGRKKSHDEKCLAAKTRENFPSNVSAYEMILRECLTSAKIPFVPQLAVGPYNCDIASRPVAVEVWGGGWHFGGSHLARTPERIRYLLDAGWHVFILVVNGTFPLTPEVSDYVVSYVKKMRRSPSSVVREYRVIWGAGEHEIRGSADDDEIAIIKPFTRGRDTRSGRYTNVPR